MTVLTHPTSVPNQTCSVSSGSGAPSGANVTNVNVTCADKRWALQAYLKAPNTSNSDSFGKSVAVNGDAIAVGAYKEDSSTTAIINGSDLSATNDSGTDNGAVYVFRRSGTAWSHEAYLKASNTSNSDWYGFSVAVNGDTIAVGAYQEDSSTTAIINGSDLSATNDSGTDNGAVYVYTYE
ncbi:MAG: FG-GAP repeat protein [Deltaproteobacteria bacterium]|nr:FG-GAP repeat protein [Deltaproteobacteria bacterium]